jgi:hypothetical protein
MKAEISAYQNLFVRRITSDGKVKACEFLKALYNYGIKVSLEYKVIEPLGWCKSDKEGFPRCIKYLKKYLTSPDLNHRRAALTILRQYEEIYCEPSSDYVTITQPGPDPSVWDPYRSEWKQFLKRYKDMSPEIKDEIMHMTAKNGPNGPAMIRSHIDALAISLDKELESAIFSLYSCPTTPIGDNPVRVSRFERKLKVYESALALGRKMIPRLKSLPLTSRLQLLAAGGCKTRVIAICDFFSQDALRPLHKWAYRFLSKFDTDGTSSHNRVAQIVCDNTAKGNDSFCFDLTAATDRFPIFLQTEFLEATVGSQTAYAWQSVISKRKFAVPGTNNSLEYKCGQPMGALSSWAIFALTHHAIVEFCAHLEGYKSFKRYVIIGDDVAIFDSKVASRYEQILKVLEVPISITKSVSSMKKIDNLSRAEIAKRLFLNGKEISPIPTGAIKSAKESLLLFPGLVRLCQERGVENFSQTEPVHQICRSWYSAMNVEKVAALVFYPGNPLLTEDSSMDSTHHRTKTAKFSNPWTCFDKELIESKLKEVTLKRLKDKADRVYKDLLTDINDDPVWEGLMDNLYDPNLPLHPVSLMWRSIRDKISQTYLKVKTTRNLDPSEVEFILDPLLRDYRRKYHRRFKLRGILIQKVLEELRSL